MTLHLDLTDDFATFDGAANVELRNPGAAAPRTVPALRRIVTRREAEASGGKLLADDGVFHLPAEFDQPESDQPVPEVGAVLTEADGRRWTLLEVRREALGARFRCVCRRWEIVVGLMERVSIKRAVWTKTASGVPVAEWVDYRHGVAARLQPIAERLDRTGVAPTLRATHRCYLPEPIEVDANCRLRHGDMQYDVVGIDDQARLEHCVTLLLERLP